MDPGSKPELMVEVNAKLTEILNQLKQINAGLDDLREEVGDVKRQQHTLELNLGAIQNAYQGVLQQITSIDARCTDRAERIRSFLNDIECAGPPSRKTPSRDVPSLRALGKLSEPEPDST